MGLFHKKSGPEGGGLAVQIREGAGIPLVCWTGMCP